MEKISLYGGDNSPLKRQSFSMAIITSQPQAILSTKKTPLGPDPKSNFRPDHPFVTFPRHNSEYWIPADNPPSPTWPFIHESPMGKLCMAVDKPRLSTAVCRFSMGPFVSPKLSCRGRAACRLLTPAGSGSCQAARRQRPCRQDSRFRHFYRQGSQFLCLDENS